MGKQEQNYNGPQYWNIHGKQYNLESFLETHPGGSKILKMSRNQPDLSAIFESYHAMCDQEKIKKMMRKYEVEEIPPEYMENYHKRLKSQPSFSFEFYKKISKRVRKEVFDVEGTNQSARKKSKANLLYYLKVVTQVLMYIGLLYLAFATDYHQLDLSLKARCFCSLAAGSVLMQTFFSVAHDAGHFAISTSPVLNETVSWIWHTSVFWGHTKWILHHLIRHHIFTGDENLDPDVHHAKPLVRKHPKTKRKAYIQFPRELELRGKKFWGFLCSLVFVLLPGMAVGKSLSYTIIWPLKGHLWKMTYDKGLDDTSLFTKLAVVSLYAYFIHASPLVSLFFFIGINIQYAICVIPDHDVEECAFAEQQDLPDELQNDWGAQQILHSANFCNYTWSGYFLTVLCGGINFQIEHHLFPGVSHIHLEKIAPIVREICEEHNLPYTEHPTLYSALSSFVRTVAINMDITESTKIQL